MVSCKKDETQRLPSTPSGPQSTPSGPQSPQNPGNNPPVIAQTLNAFAGGDKLVFLPNNISRLFGGYSTNAQTSFKFLWRKIAGPANYTIETPDSLSTKLSNLSKGIYSFELTITASANNLISKDTCEVIANDTSAAAKEIVYDNRIWRQEGLLWGSTITIQNLYTQIPLQSVFKVYIKRDGSNKWEEMLLDDDQATYYVVLSNKSLNIWSTMDETDTPDIKVIYW
jgi:hypothetical protein